MTYNELLVAFFERSNALETLWTIYVTFVGALLAFCATRQRLGLWTMFVISAAFLLFAAGNLSGMRDVSFQRVALKQAIVSYQSNPDSKVIYASEDLRSFLKDTLDPTPYYGIKGVRVYHYTFDFLTIAAFWIIGYRPMKRTTRRHRRKTSALSQDAAKRLGYFDEAEGRVEPGPNPFAAKVLTMPSV